MKIRRVFSLKISKNYAVELSLLRKIRQFKDGISFFELITKLDLYRGDHNPRFEISLMVLNFMVFEFNLLNMNHVEDDDENSCGDGN
jgi:hypothetical protein